MWCTLGHASLGHPPHETGFRVWRGTARAPVGGQGRIGARREGKRAPPSGGAEIPITEKQFRGGRVCKARRRLSHSTLRRE